MELLKISPSKVKNKRYTATFSINDKIKKVHFGSPSYSNYTIHEDEKRKKAYLKRHQKNEDWDNPITPGALSRWILWNKPTLSASVADFKRRYDV